MGVTAVLPLPSSLDPPARCSCIEIVFGAPATGVRDHFELLISTALQLHQSLCIIL